MDTARPTPPTERRTPILDGGPLPEPARAVLDLITEHARLRPDTVALLQEDGEVTYGQLLKAVADLAGRLVGEGAGPGHLIAIKMRRGSDAVVAILATLATGAAYLPLDPDGPDARNAAILRNAAPILLISPGLEITPLDLGFGPPLPADDLAYVMHTFTLAERPSGVMISRRALDHFVAAATARYGIAGADRVLHVAPLDSDASVEEIFPALCAGASLVPRADGMAGPPSDLLAHVAKWGVTVLYLPTPYWTGLTQALVTGAAVLPPSVRLVIIGCQAALADTVRLWKAAVDPGVTLLNTYGATETTVVATVANLAGPDAPPLEGDSPIGLPLPGTWAVVLDSGGRSVPLGAAGELHLVGTSLAAGYLGRPDLTDDGFITLGGPLGTTRAYRTGDLARLGGDGRLVFVGRLDHGGTHGD